ncbi:hypothetical protein [Streptomyces rhizosphaericus]|uniref:Uncharacterized protein n=1 Tax=Streptomyces rhizosphaericus TaxID=114699 RepID=A0A6G4AWR2_9ACTN|nr:hypothetical protein [Streptomyces rhizosphaericus]NEW77815.1 hypothetical protein [Streptomyces rhizosphaericus]
MAVAEDAEPLQRLPQQISRTPVVTRQPPHTTQAPQGTRLSKAVVEGTKLLQWRRSRVPASVTAAASSDGLSRIASSTALQNVRPVSSAAT